MHPGFLGYPYLMPSLDHAPLGSPVTLVAARLTPAQTRRLATLGLRVGARLQPMLRTSGGGRIVGVGSSRIALDKATLRLLEVA